MSKKDKVIEIEITEKELRDIINDLITMGQYKQYHPIKFVYAMIKLVDTICDAERIDVENILSLYFDTDNDSTLH